MKKPEETSNESMDLLVYMEPSQEVVDEIVLAKGSRFECTITRTNDKVYHLFEQAIVEEILMLRKQIEELKKGQV